MPEVCPHCGRETERRERFCEGCGAFLGWNEGQPTDTEQLAQAPPREEEQRAGVQIRLENELIEVAPGGAESTAFVIKNLGTKVEEFRFSLTGPEWLTVDPATVSVYPGQEATGTVQAAPPRTPSCPAGIAPFQLTVTSTLHTHVSDSAAGRVDIAAYHELNAELHPTSTRGRWWTRHQITLDNRGNAPLRVLLNPTDVADGLRLSLSPVAEVAPGEVAEVAVAVHGRRRWFGRPEPRAFSIIVEAPKPLAPIRLQGSRILVPVFPWWIPVAAAGVLAASVAVAVIATKAAHKAAGQPAHSPSSPATKPSGTSGSSTSSSSSNSPPTSSPPLQVADVTGFTLQNAQKTLGDQGLKPRPTAFWEANAPEGNVVRTNPVAGATASPGSTVQVLVPTDTQDLFSTARAAQWMATSQFHPPSVPLQFGGQEIDPIGAVRDASQATLENGTATQAELETHPPPVTGDAIWGVYTLPAPTIAGEQFRADIGFRQGSGGTIKFRVFEFKPDGSLALISSGIHAAGTSQLKSVHADLDARVRKVELQVTALDLTPARDDVIWVNPRIEEQNAPTPSPTLTTPTPTTTTPTPTPTTASTSPTP